MRPAHRGQNDGGVIAAQDGIAVEPVSQPGEVGVEEFLAGAEGEMGQVGSERRPAQRSPVEHRGGLAGRDQVAEVKVAVTDDVRDGVKTREKFMPAVPYVRQLVGCVHGRPVQ